MAKGLDTGKAFYQGLLSKITDPEQRAAAEKLLANDTFITEIGNGVAGQSEIDRQLSELRTKQDAVDSKAAELATKDTELQAWHDNLAGWKTQSEDLLAIGKQAKAAGWKPGQAPAAPAAPAAGLTPEALAAAIDAERAGYLGYDLEKNKIQREHFETFGGFLDIEPLLRHPKIKDLGLTGVYQEVHKDALAAKATERQAAHDKKIADEAVQKFQAGQSQMPYPTPSGASSGSPLDALTPEAKSPLVDAAVLEYQRLQQARPASV